MSDLAVPAIEVNEFVDAFEAVQLRDGDADLADFLPEPTHPLYGPVLRELVRVDLEIGWERGRPTALDEYGRRFPALYADAATLADVAFEEYRLRLQAGQHPSAADYRSRYGVDTSAWPDPAGDEDDDDPSRAWDAESDPVPDREWLRAPGAGLESDGEPPLDDTFRLELDAQNLFRDVHRSTPEAAYRLAHAMATMPEAGTDFLGFELVQELGRGAFGRVFLARQGDLAGRLVALKISTDLFGESQTLAQLQHTNIVPIYSVHQSGPFQAVCMPYFGGTTLAAVFKDLQSRPSLPDSGKHFVSTIQDHKSTLRPDESSRPSARPAPAEQPPAEQPSSPALPTPNSEFTAALERLERLTYVQAVLWIGAGLADGLTHAHERGILHLDLKPANVLLTDDGQPMLLDFNLSEDMKLRSSAAGARMGGTLPYMAPEQLAAFQCKTGHPVDARSDIYALGMLLYELLTRRHPFPVPSGPLREIVPQMQADRQQPAPLLKPWNPAVSRSTEAIVRRCLDPDPEKRYPTARALHEDLERHLANLPLKHTPEPSLRERLGKWRRRHPAATSGAAVATAAAVLLAALGTFTAGLWQRHQVAQAGVQLQEFRDGRVLAELALGAREPVQDELEAGIEQGRRALERYHVLDDANWQSRPAVRNLAPSERAQLREEVGDLLWVLARAAALQADLAGDADRKQQQLAYAVDLNRRAGNYLEGGADSKALHFQRAKLAELLGREDEAKEQSAAAEKAAARSARDHFLVAVQLRDRGQMRHAAKLLKEAADELEKAARSNPRDYWIWFFLGNCRDLLGQDPEAVKCYTACTALKPNGYEAYFKLGLSYARQGRLQAASDNFGKAVALRPDRVEARIQRANVETDRKNYAEADKELTAVLDLGGPPRAYFLRAWVRDQKGDRAGADADRAEGMRHEPRDEASWVDRGRARERGDPKAALADYEQALKVNRKYRPALQNRAAMLAKLGRTKEALAAIEQAVKEYPDYVPSRIGRAVLLARLGQRDEALREVHESLARDRSPATLYQAANVYALTSRVNAADRQEAYPLVAQALRGGFGLDVIDRDRDMDPIRGQPEFRDIVAAARKLYADPPNKEDAGQKE